jgi:predicted permease
MRTLRALRRRIAGLFASERAESDFAAELESHVAMHVEDGVRAGLTAEEARRRALIRLGGLEQAKIAHREQRGLPWAETLWRDVRYSGRTLKKNPGFAVVSILVIALGIGANVALFTVVRSVLLRPLPFRDPSRLIEVYDQENSQTPEGDVVAAGDFYDWQKAAHGFEQMAMWRWTGFNMSGDSGELPEFLNAGACSWNLFSTLGVQPVAGRSFMKEDDREGAARTAILSWSFFERRFHGDLSIVGKTIRLNAMSYTILGVMPRWFTWPNAKVQLWVPYRIDTSAEAAQSHYDHMNDVVARLRPGVSEEQATEEINAIQHQLYLQLNTSGAVARGAVSKPLLKDIVHDVKTPLYVLMAAVGCLLLIACLNLSNLLVARSAARRKEMAIRTALGSSRARLIREQLTESLLICMSGGALGLLLAAGATRWLTVRWIDMPRADAVHPDRMVAGFAFGITFLAGILAGLLPAISATSEGLLTALQDAARSTGGASKATLRKVLLTAEIALTVVLLVGAGLLFRSFLRLQSVDPGCATKNVLTMNYFLRGDKYSKPDQIVSFDTQLLEKVRALPGVEAAGLTNVVPGDGYYGDMEVRFPEQPAPAPGSHPAAIFRTADPGYFSAMQIPLVKGRFFTEDERLSQAKSVIVSQKFVRRFFANEDPIGKHVEVTWGGPEHERYEIVGVVGDTLYSIDKEPGRMMWFPILAGKPAMTDAVLVVRAGSNVSSLAIPIQKTIAGIDPDLPVKQVLTMEEILGESTANSSFTASLVMAFAGVSLLLAAVGLYGVLAYLVTQRTTEIGIRMALGARREQVLRLVLLDGLRPAFIGLALGIAGGAGATQLIQSLLYGTRPLDAVVFVSVIATLLLTACAACVLPAWRAARVDPMRALRTE